MNIFIIGAGGMGRQHFRSFQDTGRCHLECMDISSPNLDRATSEFGIKDVFDSLAKVRPERYSGVVIATPPNTHLEYANWCVDNKLPFLLEKPLSVTEEGVLDLVRRVENSGIPAGIAFPRRVFPIQLGFRAPFLRYGRSC